MTPFTRRNFLKSAALTAGGAVAAPMIAPSSIFGKDASANRLNLAVIGPGGRGAANLAGVAKQNIVAICDVDDRMAGKAYEQFPKAKKFFDFREMFDRMERQIDGVVISTPDHTHFHPAWWSIERGKHVYLEKPMAHSLWEVRRLTQFAAEKKVATQLGVQRHTLEGLRLGVELVKAGVIGPIKEVYSWIDSVRGMPKLPQGVETAPSTLKWDLWLGPAADRSYSAAYVPYNWRFWWDFGTGETGNWGCHILDIPFWALDLKYPTKVEATGPAPDDRRTPTAMNANLEFPATDKRPAVTLHWSQGRPAILKELGVKDKGANNLFVGADGMLLCGFDKTYHLLPEKKFKDFKLPKPTILPSPGFYEEWLTACRGGEKATCNFDYSGPMAETVLLANLAYRVQGGFEWDAANLKPKDNAEAEKLIRPEFRKGWEING